MTRLTMLFAFSAVALVACAAAPESQEGAKGVRLDGESRATFFTLTDGGKAPHGEVVVLHDDLRGVTCWELANYSVSPTMSCLPDQWLNQANQENQ